MGENEGETLAERDARLYAWLDTVSVGDIVTVRLNDTDTLTGKVYEAPDASGRTALYVNTTLLRFGNGYPGYFEPEDPTPSAPTGDHGGLRELSEAATILARSYYENPALTLDETPDAEHWLRVASKGADQRQRDFHDGFREGLASARDQALAAHPVPEPAQVGEVGAGVIADLLLDHRWDMVERVNADDANLRDYAATCACGEWNAFDNDGLHVDHVAAVLVAAGVIR